MSGTCSPGWLKAGTCMSMSRPKLCRAEIVMSGSIWALSGADESLAMVLLLSEGENPPPGSEHRAVLEGGIGEVDMLQPFLGRLVAAIGVGVELLGQDLVADLDLGQGDRHLQVERGERPLLRRARLGSPLARSARERSRSRHGSRPARRRARPTGPSASSGAAIPCPGGYAARWCRCPCLR